MATLSQRPLFEPFPSADLRTERSWLLRYGAAILAVAAATLVRTALTTAIGPTVLPFTLFFPAVLFAAWFGGFQAGALSIVLSALVATYRFTERAGSLRMVNRQDQVELLIFVLVGIGVALLSHSQKRAVERSLRAEDSERNERRRFETTLASIGDAVIATDRNGHVTFVNKIALSLMKRAEADVLGRHLDEVFDIVNEFTRDKVESPVTKVLREGKVVGLANHTILIGQDGTETPIDDSAAPVGLERGPILGVVLVFRDVTARRRAEAIDRLLASIVESSDDAIISEDPHQLIASWNKSAERIFGYSAQEVIAKPMSILAPPDWVDESRMLSQRIKNGERISQYETVRKTKAGKLVPMSLTISPVHDAGGRIVGASRIARDITDRKKAEQAIRDSQNSLERRVEARTRELQLEISERKRTELKLRNSEESLRQLSGRILHTQDEERRRIARDLHDSAGQYLAAVAMALEMAKNEQTSPTAIRKIEEAAEITRTCSSEIRTISHLLHPPLLEEMGLVPAIRWYVEGFTTRSGIQVSLEIPEQLQRFGNDVELVVFRVVQESLTNIHRHSGSKTAKIRLSANLQQVWLEIQDHGNRWGNGKGSFEGSRPGIGTTGMRERLKEHGGVLEIVSDENGTRVKAVIPVTGEIKKLNISEKEASATG